MPKPSPKRPSSQPGAPAAAPGTSSIPGAASGIESRTRATAAASGIERAGRSARSVIDRGYRRTPRPKGGGRRMDGRRLPPTRACLIDALGTTVRLLPPWERLDPRRGRGHRPGDGAGRVRGGDGPLRRPRPRGARRRLARGAARALRRDPLARARPRDRRRDDDGGDPLRGLPGRGPGADRAAAARGCGSSASPTGTTSCPRCSSGSGSPELSTASSPPPRPAPASPTRRSSSAALELAGCGAAEAVHVGDSDDDVDRRRAAGIAVLRIDREGGRGDWRPRTSLAR